MTDDESFKASMKKKKKKNPAFCSLTKFQWNFFSLSHTHSWSVKKFFCSFCYSTTNSKAYVIKCGEREKIFLNIFFYSQIAASVDVRKNRMTISSYFSFFLMSYHAIQDLTLILKDESRKIFFSACSPHTKSSPTIQYNFSFLTFPMYTKCDFDSLPICIM